MSGIGRVVGKQMSKLFGDAAEQTTRKAYTSAEKGVQESLQKFNKTRTAYKLFVKGEDEKLYPLFVNARQDVPVGEWLEADFPSASFKGKRKPTSEESFYVPTKGAKRAAGEKSKNTGDPVIIPDEETRQKLIEQGFITEKTKRTKEAPYGKVTAVAARPGWHSSSNPVAEHLGPQDLIVTKAEADTLIKSGVNPKAIKKRTDKATGETTYYVKRRAEDQVWAEVEMADDTSDALRQLMKEQGRTDINDRVPKGGSYSYVDGQADGDTWVVGGDMRIKRTLSRDEAKSLQNELGVKDLPYRDEVESILGRKFAEGGLVDGANEEVVLARTEDTPEGIDPILRQHYTNIVNGTTVQAEDGGVHTVYTKTFTLEDGRGLLIPTVFDGKLLDDKEAIDRAYAEESYMIFDTEEEAQAYDEKIHQEMTPDTTQEEALQKLVGDAQGEKQFAEGGSVERDPVSGNEVPVGALPEEVRDDVDAKLSEGEFVIPADVVRYIGLDRLMKMRQDAKDGLAKMNAMGQFGNADEATMDDTAEHSTMPMPTEEDKLGFAKGGYVKDGKMLSGQERFTKAPDYSVDNTTVGQQVQAQGRGRQGRQVEAASTAYEMKKFVHADGRIIYIPFIGGQPMMDIPDGFSEVNRMKDIQEKAGVAADTQESAKVESAGVESATVESSGTESTTTSSRSDPDMQRATSTSMLSELAKTIGDEEFSAAVKGFQKEKGMEDLGNILKAIVVPGAGAATLGGAIRKAFEGNPMAGARKVTVDKDGKISVIDDERTLDARNSLTGATRKMYDKIVDTFGKADRTTGQYIADALMISDTQMTNGNVKNLLSQMTTGLETAKANGRFTPDMLKDGMDVGTLYAQALAGVAQSPAGQMRGGMDRINAAIDKWGSTFLVGPDGKGVSWDVEKDKLGFWDSLADAFGVETEATKARDEQNKLMDQAFAYKTERDAVAKEMQSLGLDIGDMDVKEARQAVQAEQVRREAERKAKAEEAERQRVAQLEAAAKAAREAAERQRLEQEAAQRRAEAAAREANRNLKQDYNGGWQSSDSGGYTTTTTGGYTFSAGKASGGTNTSSTVSKGSGRTDGGWGWAKGGLITKPAAKKKEKANKKRKGLVDKK